MLITGYQFLTEQQAINAQKQCNVYYEIPVSPNDITQYWVSYQYAGLNTPTFWYIKYDKSLEPILGPPQQFELIAPPSPY